MLSLFILFATPQSKNFYCGNLIKDLNCIYGFSKNIDFRQNPTTSESEKQGGGVLNLKPKSFQPKLREDFGLFLLITGRINYREMFRMFDLQIATLPIQNALATA